MRHRENRNRGGVAAALLARAAAALLFTALPLGANSLVENSPFIPADFSAAHASKTARGGNVRQNSATATLAFQGIYTLDGETYINIFNLKSHRAYWVRMNDPSAIFRVVRYNADTSTITLNTNGSLEDMPLRKTSGTPMPVILTSPTAKKNPAVKPIKTNRRPVVRRRVIPPRRVAPKPR